MLFVRESRTHCSQLFPHNKVRLAFLLALDDVWYIPEGTNTALCLGAHV